MICVRCLCRTTTRERSHGFRAFASSRTLATPQAVAANVMNTSQPQGSPPAATSTSAAQPFSTPLTPAPTRQPSKAAREAPKIASSVSAGTTLKGLNYFKNKPDPVAMEDHEYPDWLWTLLDEKKRGPADGQKEEIDPRLFSKSANARRMANKRIRKMAQLNPEPAVPQVPIHEQSIDLPAGEEALPARNELTKSLRSKRRRDIKEANFLKSMN